MNNLDVSRIMKELGINIPVVSQPHFDYFINLYENDFNTKTKYESIKKLIDDNFNGSIDNFKNYYNDIISDIIFDITNDPDYKEFNNSDIDNIYPLSNFNSKTSNIYNKSYHNRILWSIDLSKANYNALKYAVPSLFNGQTYDEWIDKYDKYGFIKSSKYSRERIFGQLNHKRIIHVEKFLINKICKLLLSINHELTDNIVCINNDEIILDITDLWDSTNFNEYIIICIDIINAIIEGKLNIDIKSEIFKLKAGIAKDDSTKKEIPFYIKHNLIDDTFDIKCCPSKIFAQVYKFITDKPIEKFDLEYTDDAIVSFMKPLNISYLK